MPRATRVAIVGEAPGRGSWVAFGAPMRRRLAEAIGVPQEELLARFACLNLVTRIDPGEPWPAEVARFAATAVRRLASGGGTVVLLGRRVQTAFAASYDTNDPDGRRLGALGFLRELETSDGLTYHVVPHPSGRSRWWNDPRNAQRFRFYMRRLR